MIRPHPLVGLAESARAGASVLYAAGLLVERDGGVEVLRGSLAIAEYSGQIGLSLGAAVILVGSGFPVPIEGFRKVSLR